MVPRGRSLPERSLPKLSAALVHQLQWLVAVSCLLPSAAASEGTVQCMEIKPALLPHRYVDEVECIGCLYCSQVLPNPSPNPNPNPNHGPNPNPNPNHGPNPNPNAYRNPNSHPHPHPHPN